MKKSALALCLAWLVCGSHTPALAASSVAQSAALTGELIFKNNCSVCHGDRGDGKSRASNSLVPPPRNFTKAFDLTREYMIATVTGGKPGTAMTSWRTRLSAQQIEDVVDFIRSKFIQPALESHRYSGRMVYIYNCKSCHGEKGQGLVAAGLTVAPRSFSTPKAKSELTYDRMITAVTRGVPNTLMWGYAEKLSVEQIEAVVDYVRSELMVGDEAEKAASDTSKLVAAQADMSLPMPNGLVGNASLGEKFFMENCFTCHGKNGDGQGPRAYFMTAKPRNFLDDYSRTNLNRPTIFAAATYGRPGTEMPAWGKVLSEQEIANVSEFVFQTFIQHKSEASDQ